MDIRNNKGITLMAEVITILILMVIISTISYSSLSGLQVRKLNDMYADIVVIQENAINYYLKYGKAPVTDEGVEILMGADEVNPNDEPNGYYKVNLSLFPNISLNNKNTDSSFYYMNIKTLSTYYSKGVVVDKLRDEDVKKRTFYTLPSNYENIDAFDLLKYQK